LSYGVIVMTQVLPKSLQPRKAQDGHFGV